MNTKRVGFIGLGEMGKPMAKSLLKGGFELTVFDVSADALEELEKLGARTVTEPKPLAEASNFIIIMVRDTAQTEEVIFGKNGLWEGMNKGTILIVMNTIDVRFVWKLSQKADGIGIEVVDAPVSGGSRGAERGTLTIMAGGKKSICDECRPLFEKMGQKIFYMGDTGAGMTTKLVNNLISRVNMSAAFEGMTLGVKAGLDCDRLLEVIRVSSGRSWILEDWNRYHKQLEEYHVDPRRSPLQHHRKDMKLALELAKELDVQIPVVDFVSHTDYLEPIRK